MAFVLGLEEHVGSDEGRNRRGHSRWRDREERAASERNQVIWHHLLSLLIGNGAVGAEVPLGLGG